MLCRTMARSTNSLICDITIYIQKRRGASLMPVPRILAFALPLSVETSNAESPTPMNI